MVVEKKTALAGLPMPFQNEESRGSDSAYCWNSGVISTHSCASNGTSDRYITS